MTLVVGATGLLGIEICRRLRTAGRPVRAMVRETADRGTRAELERIGATLVVGDLKDPESLARACAGVTAVISTASSTLSRQAGDSIHTVDEAGQAALVEAARAGGVEHFVFVSFRTDPRIAYPLATAKQKVEQRLEASGLRHTILRASYFMEVWLTPALGFDYLSGHVRVYGDGQRPVSWVSCKDVARVAVAALEQPTSHHAVLDVGGPEALSPLEVVRIFEAAGAAEMRVEHVAENELREQMRTATDPLQQSFAGLMLQCAAGDAMDIAPVRALLGQEMTSVRDYVSTVLARA